MKKRQLPLIDKAYLLEKFPGKGGWTYAAIPEVLQNKDNPFGWVCVRGRIDDYKLEHYKLMPMGQGRLFLPVKASIRKAIGKEAGDRVHLVLFEDDSPLKIPQEILACFDYESPEIRRRFDHLKPGEKKAFIDWIYQARTEDTKAKRIAKLMHTLQER